MLMEVRPGFDFLFNLTYCSFLYGKLMGKQGVINEANASPKKLIANYNQLH